MAESNSALRRLLTVSAGCAISLAAVGAFVAPGVAADAPGAPGAVAGGKQDRPKSVKTDGHRESGGRIVQGGEAPYEYAPSVIKEGDTYKMWWCTQVPNAGPVPGDVILYAESTNLDGPFKSKDGSKPYDVALTGSGKAGGFDRQHACDPSVVKVGGTYYLYYGAAEDDKSSDPAKKETTIGVAKSTDGVKFERMGDKPIVTTHHQQNTGNKYGAGQPSVTFFGGKYYMIHTDSFGAASNPKNGAGQYFLRSADPSFANSESFTKAGWKPTTKENARERSLVDAFSSDLQYSDALKSWIIAHDNDRKDPKNPDSPPDRTTLTFLDNADPGAKPYEPLHINGKWEEGPGIVSTPDKHSLPGKECNRFPVDVVHATTLGQAGAPYDLRRFGTDLVTDAKCDTPTPTPSGTGEPTPTPTATPTSTDAPTPDPSASATDKPDDPSPSTSPSSSHEPGGDNGSGGGNSGGGNSGDDASDGGGGGLPVTGSNVAMVAGAGALLLAVGAGLFFLARRRRT